jgi:hypothetical protein
VVRRIFAMASQGHGIGAIAKVFNREGVPCISKSKHWYDTYIHKVLVNCGCIGEWQPRMLDEESGRFLPVGQPIKGYYPSVVTEEEFYRGQQALKSRKLTHARTDLVRNLFTEILFAPDRSSYRLRSRGGNLYLIRSGVEFGLEHNVPGVPYDSFETCMLFWLREVNVNPDTGEEAYDTLKAKEQDLEGRIRTLRDKIKTSPNLETVLDILNELETEHRDVCQKLEVAAVPKVNQLQHAQQLTALLEMASEEDKRSLRRQIRALCL